VGVPQNHKTHNMGAMQASKQFKTNELKTIPLSNHLFAYFISSILPQTDIISHETKTFLHEDKVYMQGKRSRFRVLEF
jgi:hypothetical protein